MKKREHRFALHVRSNYISLVITTYYKFNRDYVTRENIALGVHSMNSTKTNKLPLYVSMHFSILYIAH